MRRYLYLLLLATVIVASCAKDESIPSTSGKNTGVQAKDIVGTWTFEPPKAEDIVVKGSDAELTDMVKAQLTAMMGERTPYYLRLDVAFDGNQYCSGVDNGTDPKVRYQGVYFVCGGRLNAVLSAASEKQAIYGLLEMAADSTLCLNFDEDAYIEYYAQQLKKQDPTGATADAVKTALEKVRTSITEVRCPIKLVKKEVE